VYSLVKAIGKWYGNTDLVSVPPESTLAKKKKKKRVEAGHRGMVFQRSINYFLISHNNNLMFY
jgi:hypothetical protein